MNVDLTYEMSTFNMQQAITWANADPDLGHQATTISFSHAANFIQFVLTYASGENSLSL